MAIFMDRHVLPGVTPADLAEAHRKDLALQDKYGVQFLTYWYDQHRCTAFCLVDAPDKHTAQQVHREAHGDVAEEIVEVSLSVVEAFLGRVSDPAPRQQDAPPEMDPGHRAIMFTDIVGSTEMTARLGDRMAAELVRAHDSLVRRSLEQFGGRQVKHTGDGIMASFDSAHAAADCARDVQRAFSSYNSGNTEPVHIRIGMDAGEPVADSNDLFGATVQIASRLCAAAPADRILASAAVVAECGHSGGFVERGATMLKGFANPIVAYECVWSADQPGG